MRGSRLGSTSYEVDPGFSAPRSLTTYHCPESHQFTMPFYIEADEIPDTWECECGQLAVRHGSKAKVTKTVKPLKTHYDMLLERRSKTDLEAILKERVSQIRGKAS